MNTPSICELPRATRPAWMRTAAHPRWCSSSCTWASCQPRRQITSLCCTHAWLRCRQAQPRHAAWMHAAAAACSAAARSRARRARSTHAERLRHADWMRVAADCSRARRCW